MRLTYKQLKNLQVETASGVLLGNVYDLMLEIDGQLVAQYLVKPSVLINKNYLISRDQVVRFEENKIVVDDNVARRQIKEVKRKNKILNPEPVMMREE